MSVPRIKVLACGVVAGAWIFHGFFSKILGGIPRHQLIVARVLGETWAGPLTLAIGIAEVMMGLWVLSRKRSRLCAFFQTLVLVVMNSLEIVLARDLLLAPFAMVILNFLMIATVWWLSESPVKRDSGGIDHLSSDR